MNKNVKNAPFIVLYICAIWIIPTTAQADYFNCDTGAPFIQVHPITKPVKYVRDVSSAELTSNHPELLKKGHHSIGGTGGGAIGLESDVRYEIKKLGKRGCVRIKSIKGIFIAKPVIHIASDYRRGSCEYNAILEHEQKHIRVMKSFHKKYAPKIKKELRKVALQLQSKGIVPARDVKKRQKEMQSYIQQYVQAYTADIMQELDRKQKAIDTYAEYKRVAEKCTGWNRAQTQKRQSTNRRTRYDYND